MFEWVLIVILSAFVAYLRIKLVNAQVSLADMEIRYKWAQNTLDAIARKESQ